VCVPLGSDRLTRAVQDLRTEQCKTFAPSSARPSHRASEAPSSERVKPLHPSGEHCLPRLGNAAFLARGTHPSSSECACPTRASVCVPLGQVCLSHSGECAYPTRASVPIPLGRVCLSHSGGQRGFARASREAFPSPEGRCSPRSKGGVPLARRVAFPSPEGRRSPRSKGGVPFARRLAFLRGGLFIFQIANFIVHYLVLIFTIQIYIDTLIFARRAYGVIL